MSDGGDFDGGSYDIDIGTSDYGTIETNGTIKASYSKGLDAVYEESSLVDGKTYIVEGLTKKAVGIQQAGLGQDITTVVFAIMEDGTLEQIVVRDGKFKSLGTISGVSNVVRIETVRVTYGVAPAVVQGDGRIILLSNSNKNYTSFLGY